ncbi:HBR314Cp [Eremothecium sinecaudum]|uniref:HBR314Cp n=1 Tax=Eremothecium sinecaudum TaxID=45286 RepID=A0A120K1B8_9SACH|nr:HBR314Cp [Eremothecium sinecaudum]AMD19215.1 HBR314Cp [Eremothecium sinecaudum]
MKKQSKRSSKSDPLLEDTWNKNTTTYQSIAECGYESDGRSVSSADLTSTRFRLLTATSSDEQLDDDGTTTTSDEVRFILKNSLPITLTFFMEYSMTIISLFIIGHLRCASELASASLAVMTYNITGLSVIEGLASSLDTFCSQAYGAQKYSKVGLYFLRCSAMIIVASVFLIGPWWYSSIWLGYLIPEKNLLGHVQQYLRIMTAGIPGIVLFETGKRYLQAQGHFKPSTYVLVIVVPVNILLVTLFTKWFGFVGAPVGIVISQWLMALLLLTYALYFIPQTSQCWYPFTDSWFHFKRVFSNWRPMCRLAFPGLMMIEAEYLSFEVLTIMSTYFGVKAIAAQTVIANIGSLVYQIPFAMGCVVSTRIANHIGMSLPRNAKTAVKATYYVSCLVGVGNLLLIALFNKPLARMFTKDEEVIELAHSVSYILALNQLYDAFTTFGTAILRGQGRQRLGGVWNIIAYYFFAIPLSGWLAFGPLHMELIGLWLGCGAGILLLSVVFSWYIYSSSWDNIVRDFLQREAEDLEIDIESMASASTSASVFSQSENEI